MASFKKRHSEIWAVGGGKGGVGKSFILSSVGSHLALQGKQVVLLDADLGGANLHTFLGMNKPAISLTDFFDDKLPLSELIVDSGVDNMGLLTGAIRSLAPNGIKHTQKLKLFRHIEELETEYVLIDLGGGIHFNTLDTFLLADKMIMVVVPEIIAIENMYHFLKNVFYRKLTNTLSAYGLKDIVRKAWQNRSELNITSLKELVDHLKGLSKRVEDIINMELSNFTVYIVLNQIRNHQEIIIGNYVTSVCMKYFDLKAEYAGYIEYDSFVSRCINERQLYMKANSSSSCAKEIKRLTRNLLEGKHIRIGN
ncbi:MAG: P-loop NTPase [Deltaproteobacteria bacterium]|nr:P-loop NTPase [Deltaproteobacteria bacterium]MBW2051706.1 P-loop NTPase [Deltaproteobacteria bacterium]MBW2140245.1 P-loop NTPase [Deltaproteobacteria bacterium]MBW2323323.1 P-loop NTPase [Deltaproteobacteria bacterium]